MVTSSVESEPVVLTRPRTRWIVALVVAVVLAGSAGFAGGYVTGHEERPAGLASAEVTAVVDAALDALGRGDFEAFGSHFTADAVFEEPGPGAAPVVGRQRIIAVNKTLYDEGLRYERAGAIIQRGPVVSFPVSCAACPGNDYEVDVAILDEQNRIVHYWMILPQE